MYKLISKIPGVTVKLTPNPLNAKIELTEQAKRELALMITMKEMFEEVYSAHWSLSAQRNMQDIKEGKEIETREHYDIKRAQVILKSIVDDWFGKDEDLEEDLPTADRWLKDERVQMWIDEMNTEHMGDCTCFASSCSRCYVEEILGINTLPAGKHVNYRLAKMHFEEFASPEVKEAQRKRKEEFEKKYPPRPWTPDEATKKRWAEEDAKAKEVWEEHKRLYKLQEGL